MEILAIFGATCLFVLIIALISTMIRWLDSVSFYKGRIDLNEKDLARLSIALRTHTDTLRMLERRIDTLELAMTPEDTRP